MQRQHNNQRVLGAEDTQLLSSANSSTSAYHTNQVDYLLSQIHDANAPFAQPIVQKEDFNTPFYANPTPRANGYYYDATQQHPSEAGPSSRTGPYSRTTSSAGNIDLPQNSFNTYIPNVGIDSETRVDRIDNTTVDHLIESANLPNFSPELLNFWPGSDAMPPYDESISTYQPVAEYQAAEWQEPTESDQLFIPEPYFDLSLTAPPHYIPHPPDLPARSQFHLANYASPRSTSSWESEARLTDLFASSDSGTPSTVTSFETSTSQTSLDRESGMERCWPTDYASSSTFFQPQISWDWVQMAPSDGPHAQKRSREEDSEVAEHPAKRRRNAVPDLSEVDAAPDRKQKRKQLENEDDDEDDERQLKKRKNDGHSVPTTAVPARRASPKALRHHKTSVARSSSGVDTSATRARNNIDACEVKGPEKTPSDSGPEIEQASTPAIEESAVEEHRCRHPGCNRTFGRPQDVDRHMKTVASHRTTAEKEHACPETGCKAAYMRRDALLRHGQKDHGWPKSTRRTRRKT